MLCTKWHDLGLSNITLFTYDTITMDYMVFIQGYYTLEGNFCSLAPLGSASMVPDTCMLSYWMFIRFHSKQTKRIFIFIHISQLSFNTLDDVLQNWKWIFFSLLLKAYQFAGFHSSLWVTEGKNPQGYVNRSQGTVIFFFVITLDML